MKPARISVAMPLFVAMALVASPTPVTAQDNPSFNCGLARTPAEQTICSDPALGQLDREVADAFNRAVGHLSGFERRQLVQDQRDWLARRDSCGSKYFCLLGEYRDRAGYLYEYLDFDQRISDPGQPGQEFPASAQSLAGIIRSGPSLNYPTVGSLPEYEPIFLLERHDDFDGYNWFLIQYRGRQGYQWGGIICSEAYFVEGAFQACRSPGLSVARFKGASSAWGRSGQIRAGLYPFVLAASSDRSPLRCGRMILHGRDSTEPRRR